MERKYVRLQSWVTPKQKAKVEREARMAAKAEKRKVTESEVVRALIDNNL